MINDAHPKETRKKHHLRVPVLAFEAKCIKENAKNAGLTTAEYLRRLGMGYQIRGVIDERAILSLTKMNADLGRLGGLLKLWLSNDERLKAIPANTLIEILNRIKQTQKAMLDVINKL